MVYSVPVPAVLGVVLPLLPISIGFRCDDVDIFGDVGMSERQIYTAYVGYVTPLVVLWLLHCYWLTLIVSGILKELLPAKREAGAARGTDATGGAETLPPLPSRPGAAPTRRPSSKGLRARKI